jgi:hypothetical protein
VLFGLGTALYWLESSANKQDWDDPGLANKLSFQALSLDTNVNATNHLLHPLAGAFVYGIARDNAMSVPLSVAYSAAGSFFWEMLLEWREQASINDLVYTVVGGLPTGEFFVRLGDYLNSAPTGGGAGQRIAASTLGAVRALHMAIDKERLPPPLPADSLGLSSAYAHGFRVAYELVRVANDRADSGLLHRAALDAEIITMPGFLRRGQIDTGFAQGNFVEVRVRLAGGPAGAEADIRSQATFAGHYQQRFSSARRGHATMIGVGSGWRFQEYRLLDRRDQVPAVHVVGPHLGLWLSSGLISARFMADAHLDFASFRSLAFETWGARFGRENVKSVLREQGYTYQIGASVRLRSSLSVGPLTLAGQIEYGRYGSIEGADRRQSAVTRDVHDVESLLEGRVSARTQVSIAEIGVNLDQRWRGSTMGRVSVDRWDRYAYLSAGLVF